MRLLLIVSFLFAGLFTFNNADAQGWSWVRGNTGVGMDGWPVATDPSGNVFAAGITFASRPAVFGTYTVPVSGTAIQQVVMAKYDGSGNFQWATGTQGGDAGIINIAADYNGNSFILGLMLSPSLQVGNVTLTNTIFPKYRYFVAKYDPSGNVLWAKADGQLLTNFFIAGGVSDVLGAGGITTDLAGNVYVTVAYSSPTTTVGSTVLTNADPSGSTTDILLAKYGPTGTVLWARSAGGTQNDNSFGLAVTPAGDLYMSGGFSSPSVTFGPSVITNPTGTTGGDIGLVARYDLSGTPVWASASVGTGSIAGIGGVSAIGIVSDLSNNVYLTGGFKLNSIAYNGTTITNPTPGQRSLYLVKFDPANNVSWFKTANSLTSGVDHGTSGYSIATSYCGLVWVSGAMNVNDSLIVDGHKLYTPPASVDPVFIAGFTSDGIYAGASALQSGGDDQNGIACDANGNVFMCSDYWSNTPFTVAHDTLDANDTTGELLYVAKYTSAGPGAQTISHFNWVVCYLEEVHINAPAGFANYLWNDGSLGASHYVTDTGKYSVIATNGCTSISYDTVEVTLKCDCAQSLYVPNSFTPNGDGHNDVFYPRAGSGITSIKSFRIYDRWGELLFERENLTPNDISNAWNGSYQGQTPRPEVYVYTIEAVCSKGGDISKKGSVTVIK